MDIIPMEIDTTNEGSMEISLTTRKILDLYPVSPGEFGEGLPYAPENWPEPGDVWRWKVGKRVTKAGYFYDRYLCVPQRLRHHVNSTSNSVDRKYSFKSKLSLEKFIQEEFPEADVDSFFASFSWKVPAKYHSFLQGKSTKSSPSLVPWTDNAEIDAVDSHSGISSCKVGKKTCALSQGENISANWCKACCEDEQFCHNCCCILCRKAVSTAYGGYSYVKCEAKVGNGDICRHVSHIVCSLRCYMAGTVGGCFDIDAGYICRRCDAKSDLLPHVERLVATCKVIDSIDDIQRILSLGIWMLGGSQRERAKVLLTNMELTIKKLKSGTCLEDVWKEDNGPSSIPLDPSHHGTPLSVLQSSADS